MLNVSSAFKTQLDNDKRNFLYKLTVTFANNNSIIVENDGLWSGSVKFTKATSGTGSFDVGAFIIGKLNFILNNMYGAFDNYDFTLATVDFELGLEISSGTQQYIHIGRYVVDEVDYDGYLISFECLDYAYYFEQPWATTLSFPATAGAIIQEACTKCGITLATSSWDGYNIPVDVKPTDKNLTWLAAIGYAAQMCGQYAIMDNLGRLAIKWYDIDNLSQVTLDGSILDSTDARILDHVDDPIIGSMVGAADDAWNGLPSAKKNLYARINDNSRPPKVSHYPILITGVKCVIGSGDNEVEYTTGTTGYVVDVSGNPFIGSANVSTVINRIAENMVGFYFYSFDASYISRPYYEAGDLAWIEDYRNGRVYCSFITNLNFTSGQYQESSCGAETPAKKRTASYTPAMKILAEAGRATRASLDTYEAVAKSMTELISLGYGMHFSKEVQSDGSAIYYLHDGATLEESSSVWKLTSNGLVVSHDHGTTWAIDTNGNALFNVITARGLNADWINAGKIEIKDNGGNTIFLADITNKVVSIGGLDRAISLADMALSAVEDKLSIVLSDDYKTIVTASDGSYSSFPECRSYYTVYVNGSDITNSSDLAISSTKSSGITSGIDRTNHYVGITAMPSVDSGYVTVKATYKGLTASKRYYVYKRKVGGSTNYGLDVTPIKAIYGEGTVFTPNVITADAYSTTDNGTTKTAYSGGDIYVDVCLDEDTWYESLAVSPASSSLTVNIERTEDAEPSVADSSSAIVIKLPVNARAVRFSLYGSGSVALDKQEVSLLIASSGDKALVQDRVFNAITNNGVAQGVYLENGQLYINSSYIKTGTLVVGGANNVNGTIRVNNSSGTQIGGINNTEIFHKHTNNDKVSMNSGGLYFYKNTSTVIGSITRGTYNGNDSINILGDALLSLSSKNEIALWCQSGNHIYPGVRVIKDDDFPLRVDGKAAYEWSVKIPTAIDGSGKVTQYADLRIVDGIVYTE